MSLLTDDEIVMLNTQMLKELRDNGKLYNIRQVCDLLGVKEWTIYNYARKGLLEKIKLDNKTYFCKKDIDTLTP